MKNIFLTILSCVALLSVSCQQEKTIHTPTDWTWYSGIYPGAKAVKFEGEYLTIRNASQGAISSEWIISDGCKFLTGDLRDAVENDYTPFIDPSKDSTSTDIDATVLFTESGYRTITLRSVFDQEVKFNGNQEGITIVEDEHTGLWTATKVFTIYVYGEVKSAFQVFKVNDDETEELICDVQADNEVSEDPAEFPTVTFEAGTKLKFVDMTEDISTTGQEWYIPNGDVNDNKYADSTKVVTYYKMGTFTGTTFTGIQTIETKSNSYTKNVPLTIEIIKSSKPFEQNTDFEAKLLSDCKTIALTLNGAVASIAEGANTHFTVKVNNEKSGLTDKLINVVNVTPNSENPVQITLTLDEQIYGNDIVTVDFDGTEEMVVSESASSLEAFIGSEVNVDNEGTLSPIFTSKNRGFEGKISKPSDGWWSDPNKQGGKYLSVVSDIVGAGSQALKASVDCNQDIDVLLIGSTFTVTYTGLVKYGYMMNIDPSTTMANGEFAIEWGLQTGDKFNNVVNLAEAKTGVWQNYISDCIEVAADGSKYCMNIYKEMMNADPSNSLTVYIDEVQVYKVSVRP